MFSGQSSAAFQRDGTITAQNSTDYAWTPFWESDPFALSADSAAGSVYFAGDGAGITTYYGQQKSSTYLDRPRRNFLLSLAGR